MNHPETAARGRRDVLLWVVAAFGAVLAAALLTESLPLPSALEFPPPVLLIALTALVALPFLASRWRATFWALLAWFMVEDLIRKYLGNDIRVYFMKDGLYLILIVGLLIDPAVRGVWRRATGSAAAWLYAMIAWSVVLSIPMAFVDWRIPLIALKLDWQYVPLVIAGYVIASENDGVRRLLTGFVLLGIPACLVGIIQAQIGPDFLRPTVVTEASRLLRLDLTRTHDVFQPTGTFVDAGRFGSMAMLTYVSALALLLFANRRSTARGRTLAVIGVVVAAGAIWAHGGKTGIIVAPAIAVIAALAPAFSDRRLAPLRATLAVALVLGAVLLMFALFPQLSSNRVAYLSERLDPRMSTNEWQSRINIWRGATIAGVTIGGVAGAGTGAGSLGLQYLGEDSSVTGVEQVEGGYASVGQQWGVIGLVLWLGWTMAWTVRLWRCTNGVRGTPYAGVGLLITSWVIIFLFVSFVGGFQSFQNYYSNAYLWVFFGIVFAFPIIVRSEGWARQSAGVPLRRGV